MHALIVRVRPGPAMGLTTTSARRIRSGSGDERAQSPRRQHPAQGPGTTWRGAVDFNQAHRALLELDVAARAKEARRQLPEIRLVADEGQPPVALRMRLDGFDDGLVAAAGRERFDFGERRFRLQSG